MTDSLKSRLEFSSPVIQAQAVRSLVVAVLKEKGPNDQIIQSSTQSPAWESLWQQCCSDCAHLRSVCCDAVVLLVEQGHADLQNILNSVLNLLPSASNLQGLLKIIGRLLQMQADQREKEANFTCPYSIRNSPHPYITALENRMDCWPALLLEIDGFIQLAVERNKASYITMLAPFLRYLYCEPQQLPQHALLRQSLLRVLLPTQPTPGSAPQDRDQDQASAVHDSLLLCLCQLVPHMQLDRVEAALELSVFADALLQKLTRASGEFWIRERTSLLLQLLCACQRCLKLNTDCRPLLDLIQQLLPICQQDLPLDELLMSSALLLLEAPAAQQSRLLSLALSLAPEDAEQPPWLSPVLVLPVLQLLSCSGLTEPLADQRTHRSIHSLAHRLLRSISRPTARPPQPGPGLTLPLSPWYSELSVALSILRRVARDPAAAADWLLAVSSALSCSQQLPSSCTLIVTHLIIAGDEDVCQLALKACQAIASVDPCQVPSLIPVLMFKLSREKNPATALAVLNCLPNFGTHKLCVPMVLQTLQMLASAPKLKAVVMRLMTALWKKQDRVYPELQRLLSQQDSRVVVGKDSEWERVLARAACLRDVCRERPYQHAADMLAGISLTLKQCSKPDMATPAALALQGLRELCQAEVVDIMSTWKSLGPELCCDSRPLMVKAIAELLSLVPQLPVKSDDYEKLKDEVVSFLWNYASSKNPEVAACGYKALAAFPEGVHTVLHLPEKARPAVKILENEEDNDENTEEEEEKDLSIPGSSYMKLLALTSSSVLSAFELFLTSLVRQEMNQMPRGVYFSALRGGGLRSDQGKTVAGIPSFMLKTYEKNKQPGLKPGLAAGLLLSYELPVQTDREGKPMDRFLISRSRSYQQTLTALIHEVNIQPSEWHRALLLPQAWRGFMSRTFHAVLQGRRADLEMQRKRGKEDPEELQYKQHCAWLWSRDQLSEVIKTATKDSPVVQGNSILALSSLAAVVAKYENNLPADSGGGVGAGPEFVPTASWLTMVLDTLLSIISSSYKARGQVFPWFLHRSYSGENTASAIARSCASLALSLMVPVLVVWQKDGLVQVLSALQAGLPGSPAADDSQAVQFHSGLALGMVLSSLHHQRLSDVSTQKDKEFLLKSLEALESCSFNPDLEYNTGCLLGLALVLSAMCSEGQTEQRVYVCRTLDRLLDNLQNSGGQGRMLQEVLAYSVACVSVSSFCGGLVDASKAEETMNALRALTEESQQTPGFSLALGLVVHGLALSGHGKAEDIFPRLLAAWIKILLAEGCPTMQRLAAANGLVALVGSESYLMQLKSELELSSQQQSRLNEVIRAFTQVVSCSGAIGLQSNTACLLGHLHLAHVSTRHSNTAVPQDFSYLSEKSLIRSITDFIIEAGKKGPEEFPPVLVRSALTPLAVVGGSFQFPPVNWSAVLSPLMRLSFAEEVQQQCVVLAAAQAQSSQSASLFLGSWLSPPLVHSLSNQTRAHLYQTLGVWMKHVAEDKLQVFVETLGLQPFQEDARPRHLSLCSSVLQGLASAMALPDPRSAGWSLLCSTTEKIFNLLPEHIQDNEVDLYVGVAKCLSEMNDSEIDRIAQVSETGMEKTCFVLAYLTSQGRVPLLGLNDVIAGVLRGWPGHRVGWLLLQAFYQCRLCPSNNTGVLKRMEWLQELMGHIRNVAYGAVSVTCRDTKLATDFLFQLFAAAVVCWADHLMPLLLGVRTQWFPWQPDPRPPLLTHGLYGVDVQADHTLQQCLLGVCHSLPLLLNKEPWSGQTHKFIDWLLSISDGPEHSLSAVTIRTAKAALLALKSSAEFRKKAVWTRAYGW
ncbi:focadhesin isoform X1 [Oryzias melastigma]|uniref:focadhesin isoform X1 n=1 Tax=Oryzias melastigma TaxID=30732 RepID=UPI000CF7B662|nr:focadhesin isoform X1 [Oryzias melastigma]XP_024143661.1 focadhesin isoform X1 [Oryzias melastigma]XP_024143663.1 focadhesin isoform X1 [Oryzias melastigma]XP_036072485.1 focadhesin isoform X1 [Oryzias melastigma]